MKAFYTATILAVVLLGSAGVLFWNDYLDSRNLEVHSQQAISQIKSKFESSYSPLSKINSEEIRQQKAAAELIDPTTILPHTEKYPRREIVSLYHYAETCKNRGSLHLQNRNLQKAQVWHEYTCNYRKTLPEAFFRTQPFMHPSGESFVTLAARHKDSQFSKSSWIVSHLRYAHILENSLIGFLDPRNLRSILNGDTLIETPSSLLISHKIDTSLSPSTTYFVYSRRSWDEFLNKQSVRTSENMTTGCILREANLCWVKNNKRSARENFRLALLFSAGLLTLAGTLVVQIIRRNIFQRRASKQRTFVLQMLTHEIRTPATAVQLSLETLRSEFDKLPSNSQEAFLRICDQTQKLIRVIEASKQYLINDNSSNSVKFKAQSTPSINFFFEAIVEKYGDQVNMQPLHQDRPGNFDRYWIELCLNNLIDNALAHGRPPVNVSLSYTGKRLVIDIQDNGVLKAKSIEELAVQFKRGQTSHGLGLGLVLVQKITRAMGGELTLTCAPTTFSMKFKDLS